MNAAAAPDLRPPLTLFLSADMLFDIRTEKANDYAHTRDTPAASFIKDMQNQYKAAKIVLIYHGDEDCAEAVEEIGALCNVDGVMPSPLYDPGENPASYTSHLETFGTDKKHALFISNNICECNALKAEGLQHERVLALSREILFDTVKRGRDHITPMSFLQQAIRIAYNNR